MSISTELTALQTDITNARTAITNKGGTVTSGGGSSQLATDIATIPSGVTPTGNINITNMQSTDVTNYATAQVVDADLVAGNIKKDVNVLGVVGTYEGGGSVEKIEAVANDVNFYTINGFRLYSYSLAEAQALTSLPPLPTDSVKGVEMTYDWIIPLSTINALTENDVPYNVCIGATPTDGSTHVFLDLDEYTLNMTFNYYTNGTLTIDWGDGTTSTVTGTSTTKQSTSHIYSSVGKYHVKFSGAWFNPKYYAGFIGSDNNRLYSSTATQIMLGSNTSTSIDMITYGNMTSLKSITLPSTITTIATLAFNDCKGLEGITIPSSVNSLAATFQYPKLTRIALPNTVSSYSSDIVKSSGVVDMVFPATVTSIGTTFYSSIYIKYLRFGNNVTSFSNSTFISCPYLRNIKIPNDVTAIPNQMFWQCFSMTKITVPSGVTTIGSQAFGICSGLKELKFEPTTPPTVANANAFQSFPTTCKILVPSGTLSAYTSATNYPSSSTYTYEEY